MLVLQILDLVGSLSVMFCTLPRPDNARTNCGTCISIQTSRTSNRNTHVGIVVPTFSRTINRNTDVEIVVPIFPYYLQPLSNLNVHAYYHVATWTATDKALAVFPSTYLVPRCVAPMHRAPLCDVL